MTKKNAHPDVLDRQKYGAIMSLFMLPGRISLWLSYIAAPKGRVFATARHARSPIVTFFHSLIFWAGVGFLAYGQITGQFDIMEFIGQVNR